MRSAPELARVVRGLAGRLRSAFTARPQSLPADELATSSQARTDASGAPWGRRLTLSSVWAAATAFYYWTGTTSGDPVVLHQAQGDFYNLLGDGFLKGRLSILALPPKGLLALKDPYDPLQNVCCSGPFHDLALYHGHFFLTWGPTPVVSLYLPWRLLHLGDLDQNLACIIFGAVGLAFSLAFFASMLDRYAPRTRLWKVAVAATLLGSANLMPFLLRTPDVYQVSIAGAYCFAMVALYFLASAFARGMPRRWRLALASLSVGLAAGSHWDLVLMGGLLVAVVLWWRRREGLDLASSARFAGLVLGPFAAIVVLLLAYNVARFGSPMQFGASYQLAGYNPATTPFYKLGYLWPSLYYYLISPVHWTFAFPFFAMGPPPGYPGSVPSTYVPEDIGGIITTTPLLVLLAFAAFRRFLSGELRRVCALLVGLGALLLVLIAFSLPGGSMRYEADYSSFFVLAALIVWVVLTPGRRWLRRLLGAGGALLALYGALLQVALSTSGATDQFRLADPAAYSALQHTTSVLPTLVTMVEGHASIIRVIDPDAGYPTALGDYGTYHAGSSFTLLKDHEEIDIIAPDTGRYLLSAQYARTPWAPPKGRITVFVQDGTLIQKFRLHAHHTMSINLVRGLNEIYAWVTFAEPQPAGAFLDILQVNNLQVAKG